MSISICLLEKTLCKSGLFRNGLGDICWHTWISRKVIIWVRDIEKNRFYLKIPFGKVSDYLISKEAQNLSLFEGNHQEFIRIPRVLSHDESILKLTSVRDSIYTSSMRVDDNTIRNICSYFNTIDVPLEDNYYGKKEFIIKSLLENEYPKSVDFLSILNSALAMLTKLRELKIEAKTLGTHGDLTPWNIVKNEDLYSVYDFEFFSGDRHYRFDLVHFYWTREITVNKRNFPSLSPRLCLTYTDLQFYFIEICIRYANIFRNQSEIHFEAIVFMRSINKGLNM